MLNMIKDIINEKKAFQETAEFLMEDESIDDSIILGEDSEDLFNDVPKPSAEFNEEDDESNTEEKPEGEEPEGGEEPAEEPKEDGKEKSGEEAPETQAPEGGSDDILDIKIDEEEPAGEVPPTEGELPNPIGAQTGEPANAGDDELTSVEINPATNTMSDVLPIPPTNASDAVVSDDLLDTNIDSGFEDDNPDTDAPGSEGSDDLLDMPIDSAEPNTEPNGSLDEAVDDKKIEKSIEDKEEEYKKSYSEGTENGSKTKTYNQLKREINDIKKKYKSDIKEIYQKFNDDLTNDEIKGVLDKAGFTYMEAITLGGDDNADQSSDNSGDANSSDSSTDTSSNYSSSDASSDASGDSSSSEGDNEVTSAVKDKVDEISSDDGNLFGGNMDEELTKNKEAVLKKLSSITKSIEDTKNAILSNM